MGRTSNMKLYLIVDGDMFLVNQGTYCWAWTYDRTLASHMTENKALNILEALHADDPDCKAWIVEV